MKAKTVSPKDFNGGTNRDDWTDPVGVAGGYSVRVNVQYDDINDPPWENDCGCGPVSDWERRDKHPGERVLCADGRSKRFYDFQEAVKIARRDGWDAPPYKTGTAGEQAVRAVEADFKNLRAWCNGDWYWVVVGVEVSKAGEVLDTNYCGGIESNTDYWREFAAESANATIAADRKACKAAAVAAREERRESRYWAERDMVTV